MKQKELLNKIIKEQQKTNNLLQIIVSDEEHNKEDLNKIFDLFIKEFTEETGNIPNRVYLFAEGNSQSPIVIHEMKKQIY